MRRKLLHRRSLWGLLVAVLLMLVVSRLPTFAAELFRDGEIACATDCGGSDGQKHCPPNCPSGTCAKVSPATIATVPYQVAQPTRVEQSHPSAPAKPHSAPELGGVFHPPRA